MMFLILNLNPTVTEKEIRKWVTLEKIYKDFSTKNGRTKKQINSLSKSDEPIDRLEYYSLTNDYESLINDKHEYLRFMYERDKQFKEKVKNNFKS